jgi:hypothetical protein
MSVRLDHGDEALSEIHEINVTPFIDVILVLLIIFNHFRDAYRRRRCIVPVDGFFEWKAIKGQKAKQPYAIAMKDGRPFGIGGLWENRKEPTSGEWIGTRCVARSCAPNKPRQLSLPPNKQRANKHLDG